MGDASVLASWGPFIEAEGRKPICIAGKELPRHQAGDREELVVFTETMFTAGC